VFLTRSRDLGAPLVPLVAVLCQLAWLENNPAASAPASKNPWRPLGWRRQSRRLRLTKRPPSAAGPPVGTAGQPSGHMFTRPL